MVKLLEHLCFSFAAGGELSTGSSVLTSSEAEIATVLTPNGASVLASWLRARWVPSLSEAVIASLFAPIGALALTSQEKRGLAL